MYLILYKNTANLICIAFFYTLENKLEKIFLLIKYIAIKSNQGNKYIKSLLELINIDD